MPLFLWPWESIRRMRAAWAVLKWLRDNPGRLEQDPELAEHLEKWIKDCRYGPRGHHGVLIIDGELIAKN
jgi:hypothetical protein